jgi:hypothetical protein
MTARQPSRLALAIFDCFGPGSGPLRGDLLEEFAARQSQLWLWWQVAGALVCQQRLFWSEQRPRLDLLVVGAAVLVLVSFEVVFVTNAVYRFVFGPPLPNINGYLYLSRQAGADRQAGETASLLVSILLSAAAFAAALPAGWWLFGRLKPGRPQSAIALVLSGVLMWAAVTLSLPFAARFLSTLALLVGFLAGGRLASATEAWRREYSPPRSV